MRILALCGSAILALGCGATGTADPIGDDGQMDNPQDPVGNPPLPPPPGAQERCDKMDILFVIDNSGSMGGEQENLASNFPAFVDILDTFVASDGSPLDYRVAVTTSGVNKSWSKTLPGIPIPIEEGTDGGDDGAFRQDCGMTRRWLERSDADVKNTFSCVAQVGTDGPADEMQLEALNQAVTSRVSDGINAGFLRDDALLAVVILTDENDCSRMDDNFTIGFEDDVCDGATPVNQYVSILDSVKGDRSRWATAIIAGIGPGDCSSDLGAAEEATRLLDFADQIGTNAVRSSICDGDLATGLQKALETFDQACETFTPIE